MGLLKGIGRAFGKLAGAATKIAAPALGPWGAIAVEAGTTLLGGAISNRQARKAEQRAVDRADPATIRKKYEEAGFNPLLGLGQPTISSIGHTGGLGDSISRAGQVVANGITVERQLQMQKQQLQQANENLTRLVDQSNLSVNRGGIYAELRSDGHANGNGNSNNLMDDAHGPSGQAHAQQSEGRAKPQREVLNQYVDVYNSRTGQWFTVPNPELTEVGPAELLTSTLINTTAEMAQNEGGAHNLADGETPIKDLADERLRKFRENAPEPWWLFKPNNKRYGATGAW